MEISTRQDAKQSGEKFYFTGKPCVHGHIDKRQTSNGCCYTCSKIRFIEYSEKNREKIQSRRERTRDTRNAKNREYRAKNKEKRRKYIEENRDRIQKKQREYFLKHKDHLAHKAKLWRERNKEKLSKINSEKYRENMRNPDFRLKKVMRQNVRRVLLGDLKNESSEKINGYSTQELRMHIERMFLRGMNWDNYGDWHIDHIIPICWYIENGINDCSVVNALSNLRPMWAKDNIRKSARIQELL